MISTTRSRPSSSKMTKKLKPAAKLRPVAPKKPLPKVEVELYDMTPARDGRTVIVCQSRQRQGREFDSLLEDWQQYRGFKMRWREVGSLDWTYLEGSKPLDPAKVILHISLRPKTLGSEDVVTAHPALGLRERLLKLVPVGGGKEKEDEPRPKAAPPARVQTRGPAKACPTKAESVHSRQARAGAGAGSRRKGAGKAKASRLRPEKSHRRAAKGR